MSAGNTPDAELLITQTCFIHPPGGRDPPPADQNHSQLFSPPPSVLRRGKTRLLCESASLRGLDRKRHAESTCEEHSRRWQRCERTASVKQMGVKCGNGERKDTQGCATKLFYAYINVETVRKEGGTGREGWMDGWTSELGFRRVAVNPTEINRKTGEKKQKTAILLLRMIPAVLELTVRLSASLLPPSLRPRVELR